ncbi:hypothetical protein AB434_2903 [Heyndrickxia coagulans]|uniref:Uncharacterized protein n=1 Tax=Heyndrickxia coagulans TaxID=1398 RepID=A0AAN0T5B3_HEYCO|nr:hypothetical protein SB48_HM08orf03783 [Heyndrickxia coagulans]AKN55308.1 hypothetical protein AB434_2903 [Heyndrickxia coagulans]
MFLYRRKRHIHHLEDLFGERKRFPWEHFSAPFCNGDIIKYAVLNNQVRQMQHHFPGKKQNESLFMQIFKNKSF